MKKLLSLILCLFPMLSHIQAQYAFTEFDLNTGADASRPLGFMEYNKRMYFSAVKNTHGRELWVSDGTPAGTKILKDIYPGAGSSTPQHMVVMNHRMYFSAESNGIGRELWMSDGSATGTVILKDIETGTKSSSPEGLFVHNGTLYFSAVTYNEGRELWVSNGTSAGTNLLKDISPGMVFSSPYDFTVCSNKVYFLTAAGELWKTDGSPAGTQIVYDINTSPTALPLRILYSDGGRMYLTAGTQAEGLELWVSDGTDTGTHLLKDINPGPMSSFPRDMVYSSGKVYFTAEEAVAGNELWVSDGTPAGTQLLKDIAAGSTAGQVRNIFEHKGLVYFSADDRNIIGNELWKTDGTPGGTGLAIDIKTGYESSFPATPCVYLERVFLTAIAGSARQLLVTDTSMGKYSLLAPPTATTMPFTNALTTTFIFDSAMFFTAEYTTNGIELWSLKDTTTHAPGSVDNLPGYNTFSLFPNPGNGYFTLAINSTNFSKGELSVFDMSGKLVTAEQLAPSKTVVQVNLSGISRGIYSVHVILDDEVSTQKLVIQ